MASNVSSLMSLKSTKTVRSLSRSVRSRLRNSVIPTVRLESLRWHLLVTPLKRVQMLAGGLAITERRAVRRAPNGDAAWEAGAGGLHDAHPAGPRDVPRRRRPASGRTRRPRAGPRAAARQRAALVRGGLLRLLALATAGRTAQPSAAEVERGDRHRLTAARSPFRVAERG